MRQASVKASCSLIENLINDRFKDNFVVKLETCKLLFIVQNVRQASF